MKNTLKYKLMSRKACRPIRSTAGAAGFDLTVAWCEQLEEDCIKYHSEVAFEIPEGYVGLLFPRSSIYKTAQTIANSVGVIDSDYRGEVSAVMYLNEPRAQHYLVGDRFAQLVIVPQPAFELVECDELTPTERGEGGYGSTGI